MIGIYVEASFIAKDKTQLNCFRISYKLFA